MTKLDATDVPPLTTTAILGSGDYAGLSATFSSSGGELIPVPEQLVPQSMIEWGDIPSSLEVLVSEAILHDNNDDDKKKKKTLMERTIITVLPEVGCGIDNLETTKKVEEYNLQDESRLVRFGKDLEVIVLDRKIGASLNRLSVETIFQVEPEVVIDEDAAAKEQKETEYPRRIRISLTIDRETNSISKDTITLNVERLYSTTSTKGTRWSGPSSNSGGLDARSVLNCIGRGIVYGDVFAVKRVKNGEEIWSLTSSSQLSSGTGNDGGGNLLLERTWEQLLDKGEEVHRNGGTEDDTSIVTVRLPQNILVRHGNGLSWDGDNNNKDSSSSSWGIEVSHFQRFDSKLYRRSVLRLFDSDDGFGSVSYSEEENS
jgi:hypothetical protein